MSSPRSREDQALLDELLEGTPRNRDPRGWFMPGHKLGGRPPGLDFRAVISEYVRSKGKSLEEILARVFEGLMLVATTGDTNAAKLLIERFCGKDPDVLDLVVSKRKMSDTERAARIGAILKKGGWTGETRDG